MGDVIELLATNLVQRFALGRELLVDLYRFLRHDLVALFGTAGKKEVRSGSHPFVTVRIQTDTNNDGLLRSCFRHRCERKASIIACKSNSNSPNALSARSLR